ncbi:hypothetical protein B5X24_HaOG212027 [Helicoverpa armigera]|nr:hypothetical protein B5X24_HaOG212027 [Helicoverpa armigera]
MPLHINYFIRHTIICVFEFKISYVHLYAAVFDIVRHAAASRPVGTGRANASRANESEPWGAGASDALLEVRYEEYFVEHDVSTADARRAASTLNLDDGYWTCVDELVRDLRLAVTA